MFDRFSRSVLFLTVGAIISSAGCSGGPKIPTTIAAGGKVMYKGKPLADAEIGFVSKLDNKDVLAARGTTNADGEFSLSTYIDPQHEVAGATPGVFVVTVTKSEKMDDAEMMKKFTENPAMEFKTLVPEKYANSKASPLVATVALEGENSFELILED